MSERDHEAWLHERAPHDLGDGVHRWGRDAYGDLWWLHRCEGGRLVLGTIDVTTPVHTLVSEDPLHVEPSILCVACGDHGFVRDGRWEAA